MAKSSAAFDSNGYLRQVFDKQDLPLWPESYYGWARTAPFLFPSGGGVNYVKYKVEMEYFAGAELSDRGAYSDEEKKMLVGLLAQLRFRNGQGLFL